MLYVDSVQQVLKLHAYTLTVLSTRLGHLVNGLPVQN